MSITFGKFTVPSAHIGEDNMLPDIHCNKYIRTKVGISDKLSADEKKYVGYGTIPTLLPYTVQDNYDRNREVRGLDRAVLENEYLKAVFVTELGGRLWSLYDKKRGRELLYKNEVFQPANLALRNAWFSGGVEWNVGIRGHNPLTVSPMFAVKAHAKDGGEILKMYEYERIRGVVYSICATLAGDVLLVKVTIENRNDHDVPMYWWSNMAIPEKEKTRVLAPAREMFYCAYENGEYVLSKSGTPELDGVDISYPKRSNRSRDFFFKIPDGDPKWVAGVDENGRGLLEFSTENLIGRKMFVWGQGIGGKHWNEWLSDSDRRYIEIQAGLLHTQLEHFPMKKNSELSFIEGFCAIDISAEKAHGDYFEAVRAAGDAAAGRQKYLGEKYFDIEKEDEIAHFGSGWGALENKIRKENISKYCVFPSESITAEQKDWLALAGGNPLPERDVRDAPPSYVTGEFWEKAIEKTMRGNWYEYLQLGVIKYARGDFDAARACFEKSIEIEPSAWAYRNLAQIKGNIEGDTVGAARDMEIAADLSGGYVPILIETATALMRAGEYFKQIERYKKYPEKIKENGRLKMLTGACYVYIGDTETAKDFINEKLVVADIMEGEYSLSEIWIELYARVLAKEKGVKLESIDKSDVLARYPLPYEIDFRMK